MEKRKKNLIKWALGITLLFLVGSLVILPRKLFDAPTSYVIEDRNGLLLSASIAADGQWRFPPSDTIPENFRHCITQFEDHRFNWHFGIDPLALARALRQNIIDKKIVSGASTISMQVIRMSRNQKRTVTQKLIEMFLAIGLELRYSKAEILKKYADNAPFGSNVVGLEAAAWRYFGRSPEMLSWAESATLAVLPNAPSLIHPGKNRHALLAKRNALLDRLAERQIISHEMAGLSKLEPLPEQPFPLPQHAPHLLQRFRRENTDATRHTRLVSTIDAPLQERVMEILQRHYIRNRSNGILNAAALIIDVDHSHALAYVGNITSKDAEAEPYVDMIAARRSPGSTLKPFLYAGMLTDGLLLPHTLVADIPTQIGGYTPQNFDLGYDGAVPASAALSRSLNIPTIKMLQKYRYPRFHDLLRRLGITTLDRESDHYGLSMVLGGGEVTMWELTAAYANLARTLKHYALHGGLYNPMDYRGPSYIKESPHITQPPAVQLESSAPIDHASVYFTFQAMNEVSRPESEALWQQFSSSRKIAWKTGTSFGFRDGWAVGLTHGYVVCIWVGNADGEGRPGLTGIQTAAPILFEVFDLLPWDESAFETPLDHMIQTEVCKQSGHLASPHCPHGETTYIPASGFKSSVCPYHRRVHTNRERTFRVNRDCVPVSDIIRSSWFILPPAMEHYYKKRHASYRELPPYLPGCEPADLNRMEMIYPRYNSKIYIPLELDGKRGKVIFTAAHQQAQSIIYWHLNNEFVGETAHTHQLALEIGAGRHRLTLVDGSGHRLSQEIEILEKQL